MKLLIQYPIFIASLFSILATSSPAGRLYHHAQSLLSGHNGARNGKVVPGDSPVRYHGDPADNIFIIDALDMYPNPCVL